MKKIDFNLKNPNQSFYDLITWASLKHKGKIEALNSYDQVTRGYHGTFHISFLWYCHTILSEQKAKNILPKEMDLQFLAQELFGGAYGDWTVNKRIAEAIFAHDKVYDATSKTNELDSAKWWRSQTFLKGKNKLWVGNAIEASANHFADYPLITEDDYLLQWFLGLDLIPLAAPYEIFRMNQLMIRAEYAHLSDEEWAKGRKNFLEKIFIHCAMGKNIYQHPYLRKRFEKAARANIDRSIGEPPILSWFRGRNMKKKYFLLLLMVLFSAYDIDQGVLIFQRHQFNMYAKKFDACVQNENEDEDTCVEYGVNAILWIEMYTKYSDFRVGRSHFGLFDEYEKELIRDSI
jgi:predicted metal-dependent HD superfamily phosphohydrolase